MSTTQPIRAGTRTDDGADVIAYFETAEYQITFTAISPTANFIATLRYADGRAERRLRQDDAESGRRFYMRVIRDVLGG